MAYRDEVQALQARIAILEERYAALRARRDDEDRTRGEGRHHPRPFARVMFHAGLHLGRWVRARRMRQYASELEAARSRLAWFEAKIDEAPEPTALEATRVIVAAGPHATPEAEGAGSVQSDATPEPAAAGSSGEPAAHRSTAYRFGQALRKLVR